MFHDGWRTRDLFEEMGALRREIDQVFSAGHPARGLHGLHGLNHGSRRYWPRVQAVEDDEGITLRTDVPGFDPASLAVELDDDVLHLTGRRAGEDDDGWKTLDAERPTWALDRRLRLNVPVDAEGIRASYRHGVLEVFVPKKAPRTRRIEVQTDEEGA